MEIRYSREPIVGEVFEFFVVGYTGTADVEVRVGKKVRKQKKCADPPCHEKLAITDDLHGQLLTISATDDAGASAYLELSVRGYDANRVTSAV